MSGEPKDPKGAQRSRKSLKHTGPTYVVFRKLGGPSQGGYGRKQGVWGDAFETIEKPKRNTFMAEEIAGRTARIWEKGRTVPN